jgi:hypothetical protein
MSKLDEILEVEEALAEPVFISPPNALVEHKLQPAPWVPEAVQGMNEKHAVISNLGGANV